MMKPAAVLNSRTGSDREELEGANREPHIHTSSSLIGFFGLGQ
jgi:hypothetical protein